MTAAPETTAKWTAQDLGPRQAKKFNDAIRDFAWKAKEEGEITDYSNGQAHYAVAMMGPWVNPKAAELMAAIREKYSLLVTGSNYQAIITDLQAAIATMHGCRPITDRRRSPEEKAELNRAHDEREAKAKAESERIATMIPHTYELPETAALIKNVLRTLWPGTGFSVKSERYSGGSAIRAIWIDGPTERMVKQVMDVFQDTHFDGMDDSTHHSGPEEWNGHRFTFRTGYCSQSRGASMAFLQEICTRFSGETGLETPEIKRESGQGAYVERGAAGPCGYSFHTGFDDPEGTICSDDRANWTVGDLIHQISHHTAAEQPAFPIGKYGNQDEYEVTRTTVYRIVLGELKPAFEPELPCPESGHSASGVTVSQNEEKDGVELRFASKPATAVLERLKGAGWRWSRFSKCWYAKRSPRTIEFARSIAEDN